MHEYKELPGPIDGYKIFNNDLTCRDKQYVFGEINELSNDDPLEPCKNGIHFCKHPSGVWAYYSSGRVFKIRAYDVLDAAIEPGADHKMVARRIELVEEIKFDANSNTGHSNTGHRNTGDWNTGYRNTGHGNTGYSNTGHRNTGDSNTGDRNTGHSNTGHSNTGYSNTGHRNTGDSNTGDSNTGYSNTGHRNTGDSNTGDRNTGHSNTGHSNTGYRNTGHRNTGDWNTGDSNTGDWNNTDFATGFCNTFPQKMMLFDKPTSLSREAIVLLLSRSGFNCDMSSNEPFDYSKYNGVIPNATTKKVKSLHKAFMAARTK